MINHIPYIDSIFMLKFLLVCLVFNLNAFDMYAGEAEPTSTSPKSDWKKYMSSRDALMKEINSRNGNYLHILVKQFNANKAPTNLMDKIQTQLQDHKQQVQEMTAKLKDYEELIQKSPLSRKKIKKQLSILANTVAHNEMNKLTIEKIKNVYFANSSLKNISKQSNSSQDSQNKNKKSSNLQKNEIQSQSDQSTSTKSQKSSKQSPVSKIANNVQSSANKTTLAAVKASPPKTQIQATQGLNATKIAPLPTVVVPLAAPLIPKTQTQVVPQNLNLQKNPITPPSIPPSTYSSLIYSPSQKTNPLPSAPQQFVPSSFYSYLQQYPYGNSPQNNYLQPFNRPLPKAVPVT